MMSTAFRYDKYEERVRGWRVCTEELTRDAMRPARRTDCGTTGQMNPEAAGQRCLSCPDPWSGYHVLARRPPSFAGGARPLYNETGGRCVAEKTASE
jgi:hypothetical protein